MPTKRPAKKSSTATRTPIRRSAAAPLTKMPAIGAAYEGGIYAGLTTDGEKAYALVLLPGDVELTWKAANDWAAKAGGVLPSRIDQLVLFKNLKSEFQDRWYWSSEQCAGDVAFAWCQYFNGGYQDYYRKGYELRARAVRRLPI